MKLTAGCAVKSSNTQQTAASTTTTGLKTDKILEEYYVEAAT